MPARPEFIILQQAAEWWALLASNEAGAADHAKWQRWLDADPAHAAAWQRVQLISGQFQRLPGAPAHAALSAGGLQGRRAFAAMLVAAVGGWALWQWRGDEEPASINALANSAYGSAVGGVRQLLLADGSSLHLDTDSEVELAYSATERRIILRRGRIYVSSAHDPQTPPRPLLVQTRQGSLRALGTRFEVRQLDGQTHLSVEQGAVEITPLRGRVKVLATGKGACFDAAGIDAPDQVGAAAPAWTRKMLLADNMRLDAFLAELSRYRHGYVACAPEVAALRLVGAYPLDDQDAIFAMLEASLPVQVRRPLPWWLSVSARQDF
ncbi:MAG: Fe2+-dicitrate sensor, rane component [Pseudomonadota bacterium]|jgi:transmembrane sensor